MTAPTAIVDYSRPVGWWCPVCGHGHGDWSEPWCGTLAVPVYLPIPEGQRPPAASEVDEAEVVTGFQWGAWWIRPDPQTDSGWHTRITDALIDEITGATE